MSAPWDQQLSCMCYCYHSVPPWKPLSLPAALSLPEAQQIRDTFLMYFAFLSFFLAFVWLKFSEESVFLQAFCLFFGNGVDMGKSVISVLLCYYWLIPFHSVIAQAVSAPCTVLQTLSYLP